MKLWSVEHFCPHFFSRSALISTDLEKKWGQKCSTGQSFICTEVTSYKIHILVYDSWIFHYLFKYFDVASNQNYCWQGKFNEEIQPYYLGIH